MSSARAVRRVAGRWAAGALRTATTPAVLRWRPTARLWSAAVAAPGVPDRVRVRIADAVHKGLIEIGQADRARRVSSAGLRRISSQRARADLLVRQARAEIADGTPPTLPAAVAAELAWADARLAGGNTRQAALSALTVSRLLFDRRLHFDRLTSPLAADPVGYLREWHASTTVRSLSAPRGRSGPAATAPAGRPHRLLIATYGNHGFIDVVRRHFEQHPGVEVRFVDPGEDGVHVPLLGNQRVMIEHFLGGEKAFGEKAAEWLRPHLEWADTAFVDWCAALAVVFGAVDPGTTRVIVRLHSFEAFALWPHLVDFSRVDDLVFVSDVLRDLVAATVPATAGGPRMHVVTNAMNLRAFQRDKDPQARFTLGLVGIKALAKDPRWAVEVLEHLRARDTRYRLVMFGRELDAAASADAGRYWESFLAEIADLEAVGAVVRAGQHEDIPAALTEVGVILSSSVRESFHCGLAEGAASGAVPVVRDWPFFAGRPASARTIFPSDWVVDTPAEAAARILALTSDDGTWRRAGAQAADHAIAAWDWQVTRNDFDRLILGTPELSSATPAAGMRAGH